jgi:microcompartment protein CcmK/EutM
MKIDSPGDGVGPELLLLKLGSSNSGHSKRDSMIDPVILAISSGPLYGSGPASSKI